jgi:hemerythrin-like domain-containing protein
MKRHPALQALSREHHLLLLQARQIRWWVEGDRRSPAFAVVWSEFWESWEATAVPHLQTEERVLLPFYLRSLAAEQKYDQRIQEEHGWLRDRVAALRTVDAEARRASLAAVGRGLHDHIRWEERVFFEHLQAVLSESDFLVLEARLRAFQTGAPASDEEIPS